MMYGDGILLLYYGTPTQIVSTVGPGHETNHITVSSGLSVLLCWVTIDVDINEGHGWLVHQAVTLYRPITLIK
jgi:hypothetical protein